MEFFIGIIIIVFLLTFFIWLDFKLGRMNHLKNAENLSFPTRKSDMSLFTDGKQLYHDFFDEVRQANASIHIMFYIFRNDKISHEFITLLIQKATQGVEVRLLLDWIGSMDFTKEMEKKLKTAGVHFSYNNKPTFPYWFYKLNARNHRKISIIDGKIGYIGGFNIGDEYLGDDPKFGYWQDYHLKLKGEGVADLQDQFLKDWFRATKKELAKSETYYPELSKGSITHRFVPTNGSHLEDRFIDMIRNAKQKLIIGSPYFVPGKRVMAELIAAAKRNVHIQVLLPMKADHPFVKEAAYPYFEPLLKAGVQFYMYTGGFYHAKILILDDKFADIGTANFDRRSMNANYEINCYIYDEEFITQLKEAVEDDLAHAKKLTMEDLKNKSLSFHLKVKLASLFAYFI